MRKKRTSYNAYYDLLQNKIVQIDSLIGQAQYLLSDYASHARKSPGEWLLLCRYADTIRANDGDESPRQLHRLVRHFENSFFEGRSGYVSPVVAGEVEKEIISRSAPDYTAGRGYDVTPAVRMLTQYEKQKPVFTQPQRNIMLL